MVLSPTVTYPEDSRNHAGAIKGEVSGSAPNPAETEATAQNFVPRKEAGPGVAAEAEPVIPLPKVEEPRLAETTETKTVNPPGQENFLENTIARLRQTLRGRKPRPTKVPQVRDELTLQIENIMSEGLSDAYRELQPVEQQEFKIKGEQTAWQIRTLLKQTKIKIKKIFQLLLEWLRLLPGINRLFLEQEAKIKADKIIALHRSQRG